MIKINSPIKYLLNNYPVPDSLLSGRDTARDKTDKTLCSPGDDISALWGLAEIKR